MAFNPEKFQMKRLVKFYRGSTQISQDDITEGESVNVLVSYSDNTKKNWNSLIYSKSMVTDLQDSLDNSEFTFATIFAK